ncbi:MAG: cofactor assembly of complex C subunit B, partial [Gloeomargarita sp. HHBFW_bins_162]
MKQWYWLPLMVGSCGAVALLINRSVSEVLTPAQTRADALGIILSAVLILTGLLWQNIQPQPPNAVELIGEKGFELHPELPPNLQQELAWLSHTVLTTTPTKTVVIYYAGKTYLRRGILGANNQVKPGAIVQRVLTQQKPVYLVNLTLYPGRVEFDYLPPNTQAVIVQPIGNQGVLIVGANAPRSYTRQE